MTGNKIALIAAILLFSTCASCSELPNNATLPAEFFSPTEGIKKIFVVGTVEHIGVSDYDKLECPPSEICLHLAAWQLYEIQGYILPESEETENVRIAHRYGSALNTTSPWLATIEKISDSALRKKIGADYLLVGVEFGYNVFCPRKNNMSDFKDWKSDFTSQNGKNKCFSL